MNLNSLQKSGGAALCLGSILLAVYSTAFFTLLPFNEVRRDPTAAILNPNWLWISTTAFAGIPLMMAGFAAVYSRMFRETGIVGLLGFVCIETAYLMQECKVAWEMFLYPVIARNASAAGLFRESILAHSRHIQLFRSMASFLIFIGIITFCAALIRSKKFSALSSICIFGGALCYGLGPTLGISVGIGGIIVLSIGCLMVGLKLLKTPG